MTELLVGCTSRLVLPACISLGSARFIVSCVSWSVPAGGLRIAFDSPLIRWTMSFVRSHCVPVVNSYVH